MSDGSKKKVTSNDMADMLSKEFGFSRAMSKRIIKSIISYMIKSILDGKTLTLLNFISLRRVLHRGGRKKGLNQVYDVDDKYKIKLTHSKTMEREFEYLIEQKKKQRRVVEEVIEFSKEGSEINLDLLNSIKKNL